MARCRREGLGGSGRCHTFAASRCARRSALVSLVQTVASVFLLALAQMGGRVLERTESTIKRGLEFDGMNYIF